MATVIGLHSHPANVIYSPVCPVCIAHYDGCICPEDCDCQCPEPEDGGCAGVSNNCPVHNDYPAIVPECEADTHCNGATRW